MEKLGFCSLGPRDRGGRSQRERGKKESLSPREISLAQWFLLVHPHDGARLWDCYCSPYQWLFTGEAHGSRHSRLSQSGYCYLDKAGDDS